MRRPITVLFIACASPLAAQQPPVPKQQTSTPAAPRDAVRIGTYDLEITTDNGTMVGWLTIKREKDELVAAINAGGRLPAVKSFVKDGAGYVLTVGHDNFVIAYKLAFARDSVAGSFTGSGGMNGTVRGSYRP